MVRKRVGGEGSPGMRSLYLLIYKEHWEDDAKSVKSICGVHNALYFTLGPI